MRVPETSLQPRDVGRVQSATVRQRHLSQARVVAPLSKIDAKALQRLHQSIVKVARRPVKTKSLQPPIDIASLKCGMDRLPHMRDES
jgi:hypothetical protein